MLAFIRNAGLFLLAIVVVLVLLITPSIFEIVQQMTKADDLPTAIGILKTQLIERIRSIPNPDGGRSVTLVVGLVAVFVVLAFVRVPLHSIRNRIRAARFRKHSVDNTNNQEQMPQPAQHSEGSDSEQ